LSLVTNSSFLGSIYKRNTSLKFFIRNLSKTLDWKHWFLSFLVFDCLYNWQFSLRVKDCFDFLFNDLSKQSGDSHHFARSLQRKSTELSISYASCTSNLWPNEFVKRTITLVVSPFRQLVNYWEKWRTNTIQFDWRIIKISHDANFRCIWTDTSEERIALLRAKELILAKLSK